MVVTEILVENTSQVLIMHDNHVVQAFASDATDNSFCVAILPRAFRCDPYLLTAFNSRSEMLAVDSVAISNHVPRCAVIRKRLDKLLCRPYGRRMLCEMKNASTIMCADNKDIQHAQLNGWHSKKSIDTS